VVGDAQFLRPVVRTIGAQPYQIVVRNRLAFCNRPKDASDAGEVLAVDVRLSEVAEEPAALPAPFHLCEYGGILPIGGFRPETSIRLLRLQGGSSLCPCRNCESLDVQFAEREPEQCVVARTAKKILLERGRPTIGGDIEKDAMEARAGYPGSADVIEEVCGREF
jgi:hypothetical protein